MKFFTSVLLMFFSLTIVQAQVWDCECEIVEGEYVCAADSTGFIFSVPNECFADCFGLTVVDTATCENPWDVEWEEDCDCPEEDWQSEGICIEVTEGSDAWIEWVPSVCYADCWGYENYTVLDSCDNGWEWEDDCDCPEEDWEGEGICIELEEGGFTWIEWVPSVCYADCWGYENYTVLDSCDDGWEWEDDCDCPEEDWEGEGICIELEEGGFTWVEWVPSACYADCWGYENYTVLDNCDDIGPGCEDWDWENDCDCEFPDDDGICISFVLEQDTLVEWVPSECFADCWGFTDYSVVDCDSAWSTESTDWDTEIDAECLEALSEDFNLQEFLLALNDCEFITLTDCVLEAPTFNDDEAFIEYLTENCPEWFGLIMDGSGGPSLMTLYGETSVEASTSVSSLSNKVSLRVLENPTEGTFKVSIDMDAFANVQLSIVNTNGQLLYAESLNLNTGNQVVDLNLENAPSGVYFLQLRNQEINQTEKLIIQK